MSGETLGLIGMALSAVALAKAFIISKRNKAKEN
jgi:hypothetical protein